MNKSFKSLCVFAFACTGLTAQSIDSTENQEEKDSIQVQKLEEIVVSDTRFAIKRENSGKTIITISSEELENLQGKSVAEIINTKSGLEISGSRGRKGEVLGIFARGGRGRQVLVLIDGVRMSDPSSFSSEYDLRLLGTANIESIEIMKGAASTLYGTNAATAVINITTKKVSQKKAALQVVSSIGTNQTANDQNYNAGDFSNSFRFSGTAKKLTYGASVAQTYASGISSISTDEDQEDVFSRISSDLRLGYQFSKNIHLDVYGNQTRTKSDFDESFGLIDADNQFISKQERLGISSQYIYNEKGSLIVNAGYTTYESESKSSFPNTFKGKNLVLDVYNKYTVNDRLYTIFGINYLKDETEFLRNETFEITDPYFNMVYVSDFGLNLNAGGRLNNHSAYGSNFVYSLNPSFTFKLNEGYVKLLGSYATSFITPSLTQLFGNFGANAELEPENNRTIEGGFEYKVNTDLRFNMLYFNRKEEDFVFFDNVSSAYANAENTVNAQGVELELQWNPLKKMNVNGNYTFTERKGDNAIRIPKHKINTTINYQFSERLHTLVQYSLTGERSDTDFSEFPFVDTPLKAFSLIDFYIGYRLMQGKMKLFLSGNNLLNETYTEVLGFNTRGRNFRMGFSLNL